MNAQYQEVNVKGAPYQRKPTGRVPVQQTSMPALLARVAPSRSAAAFEADLGRKPDPADANLIKRAAMAAQLAEDLLARRHGVKKCCHTLC